MKSIQTGLARLLEISVKSLYSLEFYQRIKSVRLGQALTTYFLVVIVVAALSGIKYGADVKKYRPEIRDSIRQTAVKIFPAELEIYVKDGKITTNQQEPYFVPLPENLKQGLTQGESGAIENLVLFDSDGTIEDIQETRTLVLVNDTNIVYFERQPNSAVEQIRTIKLKDAFDASQSFTLDQELFFQGVEKVIGYVEYLPHVFAIAVFVGLVFYYATFHFVYFIAVFIGGLLVAKLLNKRLSNTAIFVGTILTYNIILVLSLVELFMQINIPTWVTNLIHGLALFGVISVAADTTDAATTSPKLNTEQNL